MTGGLAVLWSRWGLLLVSLGALVGLIVLRAKASTLDMNQERHSLDQLRDDLCWLRDSVEHPDGTVHEQLRALEVLHRYGRLSTVDYEAQRAEIVRVPPEESHPGDKPDTVSPPAPDRPRSS
jgi:hypothetical protein